MKKYSLALLLMFAFCAAEAETNVQTQIADPKPVLAQLEQRMSSLTSLYLEFTQERHLKLFAEPLKSEGVMMIDRPGLIRWETTSPYRSILMGNQRSVAQFEFAEGKWSKLKLGFPQMLKRVMDQMTLMHQGKLDALTADFTITVSTGDVTVVTMVPRDESVRSMLAALEVHLTPELSTTRQVVMREPGGDLTRILFTREKRDVKFPEKTFDQIKPSELSVIRAGIDDAP